MHKLIVSVSFGARALFKWRGKSCLDSGERSRWLGHGDILVMDGQCQDEFLHCTSPGLEHERINVTYRWIRQHTHFCPLFKAGVVCCLPTCARGSSVHVTGNFGFSYFWAFLFLLCVLCMLEVLGLAFFYLLVCTKLGSCWCAFVGSRSLGVAQLGHYLLDHWEESMAVHNTTFIIFWKGVYFRWFFFGWKPYMLASVGQPSLHGHDACMVFLD